MTLMLNPLEGIPLVNPGDDLADLVLFSLPMSNIEIDHGDILVFAQKIVSKAENRYRQISTQEISREATALAQQTGKPPGLIQLIINESNEIIRAQEGLLIVEHRLGFVCANAGIDQSNTGRGDDWALLLPENPSQSARGIREKIEKKTRKNIGVVIIDSHGRSWRNGTLGLTIGLSGVPALIDFRGKQDIDGRILRLTTVAVADELAAAASLVMGPADEQKPIVHVRGFPYKLGKGQFEDLLRNKDSDIFR